MPATSEVETVIASLKSWAAALEQMPDITGREVDPSPTDLTSDNLLACYGHQHRPSELLNNAVVMHHLTPKIELLFRFGLSRKEVLKHVKRFLVSVVQIGSMQHQRHELLASELVRDLKQIITTSKRLLNHLNATDRYLGNSDDIGYLKARYSAGNPDGYRGIDGFKQLYSIDGTTLRDLLPSLMGSIEDLQWKTAQSVSRNRKARSSGPFTALVLRGVSKEIEMSFFDYLPMLAIEITSVLHGKAIDPSHAYRILKR